MTYEDIRRCLSQDQARDLLLDKYSEFELKRILEAKFKGKITQLDIFQNLEMRNKILKLMFIDNKNINVDFFNSLSNTDKYSQSMEG